MRVKQKLQLALKNTPTGAPLAGCSVSLQLNSDQSCSVADTVRDCNNAEEDQSRVNSKQQGIGDKVPVSQMTRVFVLSYKDKPLMPCLPRKADKLLKEGRAEVVKTYPFFTIKLNQNTGGAKQPVRLGIDPGYEHIGFSLVSTVNNTCYVVGQIRLDTKMSQRLSDRAMYRRSRRNRHHWYRPARWMNRANARNRDLMPSVQRRLDRHVKIIEKLRSLCPVTEIIIEGARFDIQKLNNTVIQGTGYQEGVLFRSNLRAFLFARENGICQYCGKKIKPGERVEMHHIIRRADGGTDKPDNRALLHKKCHKELHTTGNNDKLQKNKQYKAETFMNTLRKRLLERFSGAIETFGYVTSVRRKELNLPKDHHIDAFVIAGGTVQNIPKPLKLKEYRRNNRSLQVQKPGKKIAVRKQRYEIRSGDLIWIGKKRYVSKGCGTYGREVWVTKNGKRVRISVSKITKVYHSGTLGMET